MVLTQTSTSKKVGVDSSNGFLSVGLPLLILALVKNNFTAPFSGHSLEGAPSVVPFTSTGRSVEQRINSVEQRINRMDLSLVKTRLATKLGFEPRYTDELLQEYRRFWVLSALNLECSVPVSDNIEQVWQAHILHTRAYLNDAHSIFGHYFSHLPSSVPSRHRPECPIDRVGVLSGSRGQPMEGSEDCNTTEVSVSQSLQPQPHPLVLYDDPSQETPAPDYSAFNDTAQRARSSGRVRRVERGVRSWDLRSIEHFLRTANDGWSEQRLATALAEYRKFMILAQVSMEVPVVPSHDIDEAWHAHILHTAAYHEDCHTAFGHYKHHNPFDIAEGQSGRERMKKQFTHTLNLYESFFGEPLPAVWAVDEDCNDTCQRGCESCHPTCDRDCD